MEMRTSSVVLALACLLVAVSFAQATTLLVDRGLPTSNVHIPNSDWSTQNNFASGNYDVQAVNAHYAADGPAVVSGDSFTAPTGNADVYNVSDIRMWIRGGLSAPAFSSEFSSIGLMVGSAGGPLTTLAGVNATETNTEFPNNQQPGYVLWQLDFAVNLKLSAGQQEAYAILPVSKPGGSYDGYYIAFLEATASRDQLGVNPGGDGYVQDYYWQDPTNADGKLFDSVSFPNIYGGVPADDFSVQVFGDAVPEPITMTLVGMGICGLGGYIRRRAKAAK
jgi:hypothetical protein